MMSGAWLQAVLIDGPCCGLLTKFLHLFFFAERVTGSEQTGGVDPSPFSSGADPPSTTPATNLSGGVRPKPPRCADSGEHFSLQRQFPSHR